MSYKIEIPYLQVGEFKVPTPVGLSELLEPAWSIKKESQIDSAFISKYERTVFKNEDGRLVTRYSLKGEKSKC